MVLRTHTRALKYLKLIDDEDMSHWMYCVSSSVYLFIEKQQLFGLARVI